MDHFSTITPPSSLVWCHLLHRPEGGLRLLVHLPDVGVLDGEDDEASRVFPQQRLVVHIRTVAAVWSFIFAEVLQTKGAVQKKIIDEFI